MRRLSRQLPVCGERKWASCHFHICTPICPETREKCQGTLCTITIYNNKENTYLSKHHLKAFSENGTKRYKCRCNFHNCAFRLLPLGILLVSHIHPHLFLKSKGSDIANVRHKQILSYIHISI